MLAVEEEPACARCATFAAEVRELERCNQVSVDTRNAQRTLRLVSGDNWDLLYRCARVFVGFSRETFARASSRYGVQRGAYGCVGEYVHAPAARGVATIGSYAACRLDPA